MHEKWPKVDARIESLLMRWADWVRDEERKGGFPRATTLWRMMRYGSGARPQVFYQTRGDFPVEIELVERALGEMRLTRPKLWLRTVMVIYLGNHSDRSAAKLMHTSRYRIMATLRDVHLFLSGRV